MRNRLAPIVFSAASFVLLMIVVAVTYFASGDGDASTPAPIAGCTEVTTQELYVQHAYACENGTRVVTFADDRARDAYLKTAEGFGVVTLDRGPAWARIKV